MQVDPSPAIAPTEISDSGDKAKSSGKESGAKKYTPPVDGQSGDLILEATAYLRLLIALLTLDTGNNELVSPTLLELGEIVFCERLVDVIGGKVLG